VKQTLPSSLMMQVLWSPEHSTAAYADAFEMFGDAADFLREEIRALVQLGCEYVQIDAPQLAILVDESVRQAFRERGIAPEPVLGDGIEIINSVIDVPGRSTDFICAAVIARVTGWRRAAMRRSRRRSSASAARRALRRTCWIR